MKPPASANASSRGKRRSRKISRSKLEKMGSGVGGLTLYDRHFPPLSRGGEESSGSSVNPSPVAPSVCDFQDRMHHPWIEDFREKKTNEIEKIWSTPSPSPLKSVTRVRGAPSTFDLEEATPVRVAPFTFDLEGVARVRGAPFTFDLEGATRVRGAPFTFPLEGAQVPVAPSPSRLKEANKTSVASALRQPMAPAHGGSHYSSEEEVNTKAEPIASAVREPVTPTPHPISQHRGFRWVLDMVPDDLDEVLHMVRNGDMSKVKAWIAREVKRADAFIRRDGAAIRKVESETLEDYMGKPFQLYDQDSDHYDDQDEYHEEICGDPSSEDDNYEPYLCALVCDFLCDFPSKSDRFWDKDITQQVLAACGNCYQKYSRMNNDRYEVVVKYAKDELPKGEDMELIDLRGLRSKDAQRTLRMHLFSLSRRLHSSLKYLNVVVGCTLHGIGKGKLRQTVIDVLKPCTTLKWTEVCEGAIISISFEDFFGRTASEFAMPDEKADLDETVVLEAAKRETYLCTVIFDFLCNLPVAHRRDLEIDTKVVTAVKNCCGGGGGLALGADTMLIDVRGLYYKDVENKLIAFLEMLSPNPRYKILVVSVCCNIHVSGKERYTGKRNSSATVAEILMRDETIKWAYCDLGAFIRIQLHHGRKNYSNLRYFWRT